jgi:hypothetical protein
MHKTNLFELPDSIYFPNLRVAFLDDGGLSCREITIVLSNAKVRCAIQAFAGTINDGIYDLFEAEAQTRVDEYEGYFADPSFDFPNDLQLKYEIGGEAHSEYRLFKFGSSRITLVATLVGDFRDEDISQVRNFLNRIIFFDSELPDQEAGELLPIKFDPQLPYDKVGKMVIISPN